VFLGVQDFDFAQIGPNFTQICPKDLLGDADAFPTALYGTVEA